MADGDEIGSRRRTPSYVDIVSGSLSVAKAASACMSIIPGLRLELTDQIEKIPEGQPPTEGGVSRASSPLATVESPVGTQKLSGSKQAPCDRRSRTSSAEDRSELHARLRSDLHAEQLSRRKQLHQAHT